ncbi:MAG: hypothetical protein JEZ06_02175 [Anaerolineaceae bacterium]|nr:hypothetical protein [Anaerolineaceae bacterium]
MKKIKSYLIQFVLIVLFVFLFNSCRNNLEGPETEVVNSAETASAALYIEQEITECQSLVSTLVSRPAVELSVLTESAEEEVVATSTPQPFTCDETEGSIVYKEIGTEVLQYPFGFRVYLPPCFQQNPKTRYFSLYLLHGQSFNDDQWERYGVKDVADKLILNGDAPEFIIVMPREDYYLQDELTSNYQAAVSDVLVPWIDNNFKTCPLRECRAIGGISRGAGWAYRIGFTDWDLFSAIGLHSFAPLKGDFNNFPYWLQKIPEEQLPAIYMDIGSLDISLEAAESHEERLTKYHIPHQWHVKQGNHAEAYWQSNIEEYITWYTTNWLNNGNPYLVLD